MAQGNFAFGGSPPAFEQQEILLYSLQITVSDNWACAYVSGSGSYTTYSSIGAFITALQSGSLSTPGPLPPFAAGDTAPDLLVTTPGYVVVVLSSPDQPSICFQPTAMTTGTDCSSKYYSLTETSAGTTTGPTVAYFAVPVVAPASQNVADPYTLFVQYTSGALPVTHRIDPCIKNRGPG